MDKRMKSLAMTAFFGELNTLDIMALIMSIFKCHPNNTIFSIDKNGQFMIDFVYDNYKASEYLDLNLTQISEDECKIHASSIAEQLACADIIKEDIYEYIRTSPKLKRFIKKYRNRSDARISRDTEKLKIALAKGIDYEYIKDAC
ncbi:crescent membrane and immature virion formation protein [Skunkpox virus]|uniref:Crescent membrane and immature virion formation protein n=1 Tax=Skunkpox virus TaxID=160796 RepID=A0A1C9KBQ3_9POXV|nr:crescent membrane and immature virion formation protein [Skunkpox virus]AOP31583.1 crescent membrane and immature virion formation protein [Skunkpox virus]